MAFARKVSWRDWLREMFLQQGLFSLRRMPTTRAEDAEFAAKTRHQGDDPEATRLNLEPESAPKD